MSFRFRDPIQKLRPTLQPAMTRRRFLASSALAASGLYLPRLALADCSPTSLNPQGPFWAPGAPFRTILVSADEPGTRMFIEGQVFESDCVTPVSGAIVDVWHATDAGCYSVFQDCPDEDPFNCRGQMLTDSEGRYAYETILPGIYPGRPRHVHYTVSPPAGEYSLTTQLYFDAGPPEDLVIPLEEDEHGALHGIFDVTLDVTSTAAGDESHTLPTAVALHQNYPNPFNPHTTIRYQLRLAAPVRLEIISPGGQLVKRLVNEEKAPGYYSSTWDGRDSAGRDVASGIYLYRLEAGPVTELKKMHLIR